MRNLCLDSIGQEMAVYPMLQWAKDLFPITRSLTGEGVRQTLDYLGEEVDDLQRHRIPSGEHVFDWQVPQEWNVRDAYLEHESGQRFAELTTNNLHLMGYSTPVDTVLPLSELQTRLHTLPETPDWIPYVTSYYSPNWGFCLSENQLRAMPDGNYRIYIDSELKDGYLDFADCVVRGQSEKEILFSTYICHPSMANNELSGPVVTLALAKYVQEKIKNPRYTYRFAFVPETIGTIVYLNKHLEAFRRNLKAGFVVSCVGDERAFSHIATRRADTLADRAIRAGMVEVANPRYFSFLSRGSDERQYGSPLVDLPVCGFARSKAGQFPEYHTSADNFDLVTEAGLIGSFELLRSVIDGLECPGNPRVTVTCEPQLGKRGLYPSISKVGNYDDIYDRMNVLAYSDGASDVFELSLKTNTSLNKVLAEVELLTKAGLLELV